MNGNTLCKKHCCLYVFMMKIRVSTMVSGYLSPLCFKIWQKSPKISGPRIEDLSLLLVGLSHMNILEMSIFESLHLEDYWELRVHISQADEPVLEYSWKQRFWSFPEAFDVLIVPTWVRSLQNITLQNRGWMNIWTYMYLEKWSIGFWIPRRLLRVESSSSSRKQVSW